jgi:hypothetical protein
LVSFIPFLFCCLLFFAVFFFNLIVYRKLILEIISRISIVTNAALIVFTMNNLDSYSLTFRFWIFVLFQWISFIVQSVIKYFLIDESEVITTQKQREKFIVSKLIHKVPDDTSGYEPRKAFVPLSFKPLPEEKTIQVFQ